MKYLICGPIVLLMILAILVGILYIQYLDMKERYKRRKQ